MIDTKDLRLIKLEEFEPGRFFYRKDTDGFHTVKFNREEFIDRPAFQAYILKITKRYIDEGRLFTRMTKPYHCFG